MQNFTNNFDNSKYFSNSQYNEFKKYAEEIQPILKKLPLGSIEILDEKRAKISIVEDGVLKTNEFGLTTNGLKSLLKTFNLNITAFESLNEAVGSNAMKMILDQLRNKMSSESKSIPVIVSISKQSKKIVSIVKSTTDATLMDNNKYFRLVEEALNGFENSGMRIKNLTVSEEGNIAITIINDNWTFDVEGLKSGLKDEYFKSGMTLIKTPNKLIINPFNERLVCINGMVDTSLGHQIVLNSTSKEALEVFFEKAKTFGKNRNIFENEFKNRIITMLSTNASYEEVLGCHNAVNNVIDINHERSRIILNSLFNIYDIKNEYEKQTRVDLLKQPVKYRSKVITEFNMWDLVNIMTDISSNTGKHEFQYRNLNSTVFNLQRYAGQLTFKENYDLGSSIPQIFQANAAKTNAEIINKLMSNK